MFNFFKILILTFVFGIFFQKKFIFSNKNELIPSDTIKKTVQFKAENKNAQFVFSKEKEKYTIKTFSKETTLKTFFYTDTIENTITTFEVNNIEYWIEIYKNKTKLFSVQFDKKKHFDSFYSHNYSFITSSNTPVFKMYIESERVYVFDLDLGNQTVYLLINNSGKIIHIGRNAFSNYKNGFTFSEHEIYCLSGNKTLNIRDFFKKNFTADDYGLKAYYEILTDSSLMLSYFYETDFYTEVRNNLLIVNSDFEIIKKISLQRCPDGNFNYKLEGNFLAFFSSKFERIWLYSLIYNQFYVLILQMDCIHTESGNVLKENKETNDIQWNLITKTRSEYSNTMLLQSKCPQFTTYYFQIDTLKKEIVSCQIDQFRQ
jgi:hypothetical protein